MVQCGVPAVIRSIPAGIPQLSDPSPRYSRNIHTHTQTRGFPSPCTPPISTGHATDSGAQQDAERRRNGASHAPPVCCPLLRGATNGEPTGAVSLGYSRTGGGRKNSLTKIFDTDEHKKMSAKKFADEPKVPYRNKLTTL